MGPMVSVIIPVYNGESVICGAVQSALNQTFSDFEIIIIDDCSIDNTFIKVQRLAQQNDRIVFIKNRNNLGAAESRNIACRRARGRYIAFLDSDDMWTTNKLDKQISFMEKKGCDLSFTAYGFMNSDGQYTGKYYSVPESISYKGLLSHNVMLCSTVMIKTAVLKDFKFDNRYFHEDYRLWLELLRNSKRIGGLDEVLSYYRSGGRSSNRLNSAKNRWLIYRKAEKLSLIDSAWYFLCYAFFAIKKYYLSSPQKEIV